MLNLNVGDRVIASAYMKSQFPAEAQSCGVVQSTWKSSRQGRTLRKGMIKVQIDGKKNPVYHHHSFWVKACIELTAREKAVADKIISAIKPLSKQDKIRKIKAVACLYGML